MSQKSRDTKKQLLLRNLASMPIVEVACKRTGVSRATYYRWRTEDEDFREDSDKALFDAIELMSDLAESQLLNNVKGGNMTAIIFWLKSHREAYHTASTAIRRAEAERDRYRQKLQEKNDEDDHTLKEILERMKGVAHDLDDRHPND